MESEVSKDFPFPEDISNETQKDSSSSESSENLLDGFKSDFESCYDNDIVNDFDAIGEYFFESARLAYKADSDYKNLVQAIVVIEATREQTKKDILKLSECQNIALDKPLEFVDKVANNDDVGIPESFKPTCIPNFDWNKYENMTKNSKSDLSSEYHKKKTNELSSHNQPWTADEQSKLEQLLLIYPPEEIESRRWEKIANDLGTRTPTQVASRVQKHFIKLLKDGSPIPGRPPNPNYLKKKFRKLEKNSSKYSNILNTTDDENSRTSFPSLESDNEESSDDEISDIEDINSELRNTTEYKDLLLMKKALKRKLSKR